MKEKVKITPMALNNIADRAMVLFQNSHTFDGLNQTQVQAYLFIKALEGYLEGKGADVPFEVNINTDRNPRIYKVKS